MPPLCGGQQGSCDCWGWGSLRPGPECCPLGLGLLSPTACNTPFVQHLCAGHRDTHQLANVAQGPGQLLPPLDRGGSQGYASRWLALGSQVEL